MELDLIPAERKWLSIFVYAVSGLTVACALRYIPYETSSLIFVALQLAPLVFLILYVRFLLTSATNNQRILAIGLNCIAAFAAAGYLWSRPYWPPPAQPSFGVEITGFVIVSSALVVATLAMLYRHQMAYAAGAVAALLTWPCLLEASLSGNHFGAAGVWHLAAVLAVFGFSVAATALLVRPVFAYFVGLLASVITVPYVVDREMSYPYHGNSWLILNLPADRFNDPALTYAKLSIFSVAMVVIAAVISLLRLCPDRWQFRGRPIRQRTWPVFLLSLLVVGVWFAKSVAPYRLPTEQYGISPEISVVHFERQGSSSTETKVSVARDGRLYVSHDVRKPLRYESDGEMFVGAVPSWGKVQPILDLLRSGEFKAQKRSSARDLPRRWHSDSWYISGERVPFLFFSSAANTLPPKEIIDWFDEMNSLPKEESGSFRRRDVCLGFCYEP
jgi:hypothetical protein